jgi:2'-5' RNA ligase
LTELQLVGLATTLRVMPLDPPYPPAQVRTMKRSVRTFVAVEIGAAIRARAGELIQTLAAAGADVKWVEPPNLHLTLQFLGEVAVAEIPRVCEAVGRGTATAAPFELEVRGAGAFPHPGRPKTIWLGAGPGQQQMIALHDAVETALGKLGFRKEHRRFEPHLTLGRVRSGGPGVATLAEVLRGQADFLAGSCHVAEVVVFSSELQPAGPLYAPLGRAALGER